MPGEWHGFRTMPGVLHPSRRHHMLRRLAAALLGSVLMVLPASASRAQAALSVAGGVSAPVSDLGDIADLGYNVGVGLNFGGTRLPIGARFEGGLNGFGLKDT